MKFSTWLEVKKLRTVPVRKKQSDIIGNNNNKFAGVPGPECNKCGKKMIYVPEPKFKRAWWGKKPGDRGPSWLNKSHWLCKECGARRLPGEK